MHFEAHAGLGWALGVLAPGSDRRLRAWVTLAAVLPDIDAAAYFWGDVAYTNYHHTFGHNVFLGALVAGAAAAHHPRRILAGAVTALSFGLHLVTDMKLSAYPVALFWPRSDRWYEFTPNLGLASPINTWLVYAGIALAVVLAFVKKVSPLDLVSPRLDRIVLGFFRAKTLTCKCGRRCNEVCDGCAAPVCLRCGHVSLRFLVHCPDCSAAAAGR